MLSQSQHYYLQQLGISAYQLNSKYSAALQSAQQADEQKPSEHLVINATDAFVSDLLPLFPSLQVESSQLRLTPELVWSFGVTSELEFASKQLFSPAFSQLSAEQKKQIWTWLALQAEG